MVVDRNHLEWWLDPTSDAAIPEAAPGRRVIIACNEGYASSLAAATPPGPRRADATDLVGGYRAWFARARPHASTTAKGAADAPWPIASLTIHALGGAFAARIDGVGLRASTPETRQAADAPRPLAEHKVLVVPRPAPRRPTSSWRPAGCSATLTPAHPVLPPIDAEHPEVLEIDATRSRTDPRYRDEWENDTWHTDVSFMPDPPLGSLLAGVVIPPVGGDTAFADLQGAYDALSAPLRQLVDGLEAEHDGARGVRGVPPRPPRGRRVVRAAASPCSNPSPIPSCGCTRRPVAAGCS